MPRRVAGVDRAAQHGDGDAVGCERASVRGAVDAIGGAEEHRHAPGRQPVRELGGMVFAVLGGGPGAHERDRRRGRQLVQPYVALNPQAQRRPAKGTTSI